MSEIDERYKRGKIYTIRCYSDDTKIYVGSTIDTLPRRLVGHKTDSRYKKNKNIILYKTVNGNWNDWYIELLQLWPCNSRAELVQQEGKHIREIGTLNKIIPGRTQKEYYIDNKDIIIEKQKEYKIDNNDKCKEISKQYYNDNKEKIIEKKKEYRIENKEKIKQYYNDNKDKYIEISKQYYNDNKEKISEQKKVKVVCEHCNSSIRKSDIKQHQKTAKCLKAQSEASK